MATQEKWFGLEVVDDDFAKRSLGLWLEDSDDAKVLQLNYYSDAFGAYTKSLVCEIRYEDIVFLVSNSPFDQEIVKRYLIEKMPNQYRNPRFHVLHIKDYLVNSIMGSALDWSIQTSPDYEPDQFSCYAPDEDSEFYPDELSDFDD